MSGRITAITVGLLVVVGFVFAQNQDIRRGGTVSGGGGSPTGSAGGDLTGTYPNPTLGTAGTAGTYGDSTHFPVVTTDSKGRVTSVTTNAIPAGGVAGTIVTNAALATGDLYAVGTNPTNAVKATSANVQSTIGAGVYQASSATLGHYAGTDTNAILAAIGGVAKAGDIMTGPLTITNSAISQIPLDLQVKAGTTNQWLHLGNGTSVDMYLGRYIWSDGTPGEFATLSLDSYSSTGDSNPFWRGRKGRGTLSSPSAILNDDYITTFSGIGYDGTKFGVHSDVVIELHAGGNFSASSHPTYISFKTTAVSSTSKVEVARLTSAGDFCMGTTTALTTASGIFVKNTANDNGAGATFQVENNFSNPFFTGIRARSGPAGVQANDALFAMSSRGHNGSAYTTAGNAVFAMKAAETWGTTATGTYLTWEVTPVTTTTRAEKMRLSDSGQLAIGTTTPTSTLHVAGSHAHSIATGTAFTLTATNEVYLVNVDAQTVTLPTAVGIRGRTYTVKAITPTATATLATTSSQLIDGTNTFSLTASNKFVRVISDNANWWIIGNN